MHIRSNLLGLNGALTHEKWIDTMFECKQITGVSAYQQRNRVFLCMK